MQLNKKTLTILAIVIVWSGYFFSLATINTYLPASDEGFFLNGNAEGHYGIVLETFKSAFSFLKIPLQVVPFLFWTLLCVFLYKLVEFFRPHLFFFIMFFFFCPFVLNFSHTFTQDIVIMSLATGFFYFHYCSGWKKTFAGFVATILSKVSGFFLLPLMVAKLAREFPKYKIFLYVFGIALGVFVFWAFGLSLVFDYRRIFLIVGLPLLVFWLAGIGLDWKENEFKDGMFLFLATVLFSSFYFALSSGGASVGDLLLVARYSLPFYPLSVLAVTKMVERRPVLFFLCSFFVGFFGFCSGLVGFWFVAFEGAFDVFLNVVLI